MGVTGVSALLFVLGVGGIGGGGGGGTSSGGGGCSGASAAAAAAAVSWGFSHSSCYVKVQTLRFEQPSPRR